MSKAQRSFEINRLEILLIAGCVLILVCILGITILSGIGLKIPERKYDAEQHWNTTAWIRIRPELARPKAQETYNVEDLIGTMRRLSASLVDDFKRDLTILSGRLSATNASQPAEEASMEGMEGLDSGNENRSDQLSQTQQDICDASHAGYPPKFLELATESNDDADGLRRR